MAGSDFKNFVIPLILNFDFLCIFETNVMTSKSIFTFWHIIYYLRTIFLFLHHSTSFSLQVPTAPFTARSKILATYFLQFLKFAIFNIYFWFQFRKNQNQNQLLFYISCIMHTFFSDSLSVSDVFNFVFPITLEEV